MPGDTPPVPTGIQQLLRLAQVDAAFLALLAAERDAIAHFASVALTDRERSVLRSLPAAQIFTMVEALPPADEGRIEMLRFTAQAAVSLFEARNEPAPPVVQAMPPVLAEPPPPRPDENLMLVVGGIAPDLPPALQRELRRQRWRTGASLLVPILFFGGIAALAIARCSS